MTTTLFSATTLLFAHAKTEASDTSQAGQLVFSPSYGWIIAIIAILVLLAAMFFEIVPIRRKPESSDETFCMRLRRKTTRKTLLIQ